MSDPRKPIFDAIRNARDRGFGNDEVSRIDAFLDSIAVPRVAMAAAGEPPWLIEARKDLGLAEIPGKKHAPRILKMLALLRYPFSDDETPWCGTAMSAWFAQAGLTPPAQGYRAASWKGWGHACLAQVGAVGVKARPGGNHVFLIVGETADRRFYKALGANQRNMVSIMDVAKASVDALRWPAGIPERSLKLPVMAAGTISADEA